MATVLTPIVTFPPLSETYMTPAFGVVEPRGRRGFSHLHRSVEREYWMDLIVAK